MKNILLNTLLMIASLIVSLLLVEVAAQIYVYKVAKKGKLFQPDRVTGWAVKPNLNLQRVNADGDIWSIRTDKDGFRIAEKSDLAKKVLILGDSFAFGEGVDVQHRFDSAIEGQGYSVFNTGVMGFGTDQQYLAAKPHFATLNKGDTVLLLTYFNDFYDIARKKHSGRSKPWFSLDNDSLVLNTPRITLGEVLRDKSYIYAKLSSLVAEGEDLSSLNVSDASSIYKLIVSRVSQTLLDRKVRLVIAYHGAGIVKDGAHLEVMLQALNSVCDNDDIECLNLDQYMNGLDKNEYFLADGHWNSKGHKVVGKHLFSALFSPPTE